ncbi:MAG: hypothetical protein WC900_00170 [Oscillospiraceae bacterium]|jgi:hypothetical protein
MTKGKAKKERVAALVVLCICSIISTTGACCFGVASSTHAGTIAEIFVALACLAGVVAFGCMFLIICWVVLFADTHKLNRGGK